jgi:CBS domain-containing protein
MTTGKLCKRDVITTHRDATIREAARLMRKHHVGCLVITEAKDGRTEPVGILTDRDIVMEVIAEDINLNEVNVGDIMSYALLKVRECDSIIETAQRMRARGVRRVPVVSDEGELIGIIALDDILELLSEELSMLAKLTSREAEQEQKKRA